MTTTQEILVPVDFEKASLRALDVAKELAPKLGATVTILHVCTTPVYAYPGLAPVMMQGFSDEVLAAAKKALEELSARHGGLATVLCDGDSAAEILRVVAERKPRMLVMGTHGRRGLSHLLLGSVAEKVVRQSVAPVLTVHAADEAKP